MASIHDQRAYKEGFACAQIGFYEQHADLLNPYGLQTKKGISWTAGFRASEKIQDAKITERLRHEKPGFVFSTLMLTGEIKTFKITGRGDLLPPRRGSFSIQHRPNGNVIVLETARARKDAPYMPAVGFRMGSHGGIPFLGLR